MIQACILVAGWVFIGMNSFASIRTILLAAAGGVAGVGGGGCGGSINALEAASH